MGGLFGGAKTQSNTSIRYNAIQLNQSAYGNVIPLLYGTDRVPITLIDYQDFNSKVQSSNPGKGGGAPTTNSYTYYASFIGLLCEGPITGTLNMYSSQTITTLAKAPGGPLVLFDGHGGQAPWSYMTTNHPTHALSYDHNAYVAGANYSLGSSAGMPNITFETIGFKPYNGVGPDAHPADIMPDFCTDPNHGAGFPYLDIIGINATNGWRTYCTAMNFFFSMLETTQRSAANFIDEMAKQTNTGLVWSPGVGLRFVPYGDQVVSSNGVTYTPNLIPIFSFQDADYCPPKGQPPVKVSILPASQTYNVWNVEFLDRANQYNTAIETYRDEQNIALNGVRIAPTVNLHGIKVRAIAATVAALIAQRNLYIRNTYTFTVRLDYSLLEPMDLVSITDTRAGIVNQLVRITETTDNPDDTFTIVAEEMLVGPAHAPVYSTQLAAGYAANYGADPGSVDVPYIFTIPPLLADPANGGYEIGIAVGGLSGIWGGCNVFASLDNTTYQYVGVITHAARYGRLIGSVTPGSDPDTVNTLSVALNTTVQNALTSVSRADADALRTPMLADGEVMAYQNCTPLSTNSFKLDYLRRGLYNSTNAAHAAGTQFAMLDDGIWRMPFDPGLVGQPVWFKFQSFNMFGGGVQDISTLTAYQAIFQGQNSGQLLQAGATPLVARGQCSVRGSTIFKQQNAAAAWDSDCYSVDAFAGGCTLKFQSTVLGNTGVAFAVGLSTSPLTDQSYTSINHAWVISNGDAKAYIFENGNFIQSTAAFTLNSVFEIRYDGKFVTYYLDGVLWRTVSDPNKVFYLDSSFYTPGAAVQNVYFGALNPANTSPFVARGQCRVSDENAMKVGGAAAWDSDIYSLEGYPTCHLTFKANQTNAYVIIGISLSPAQALDMSSIEFGFILNNNGTWQEIIRGKIGGSQGTYDLTTVFALTYDGTTVTPLVNNVSVDPHSDSLTLNRTFFLDSSFYTPNGGVNTLQFGPTTNMKLADTSQLGQNASGQVVSLYSSGSNSLSVYADGIHGSLVILLVNVVSTGNPISIDCSVDLTVSAGSDTRWTEAKVMVVRDGQLEQSGTVVGQSYDALAAFRAPGNNPVSVRSMVTLNVNDNPTAGTHLYSFIVALNSTAGGGAIIGGVSAANPSMKIREYKR